jgi:hypothetical protein
MFPATSLTVKYAPLASGADLSGSVGLGAKISAGAWILADATADKVARGIIIDGGAASGDQVTVGIGEVFGIAGATVAAGALVCFNASAQLITAPSADEPVGRCLQAGGSGEYIKIFMYDSVDETVA